MRKNGKILMLLAFASFIFGVVACNNDEEQEIEKPNLMAQFVGTWSVDFGELYGVGKDYKVLFTTRQDGTYTADDWVDKEGYGIFLHAGTCTNKWRAYTSGEELYLKFEISSSLSDFPSQLCSIGRVKDVGSNSFAAYDYATCDWLTFKRYSASKGKNVLGYWQCENVSGSYIDENGVKHSAVDGSWLLRCIYFSDSGIKGHEDYNGITFGNTERKYPDFIKYSYDGDEISFSELPTKFVIENLTEDRLVVSYKGQDGSSYVDLNITYNRVPTYDNK